MKLISFTIKNYRSITDAYNIPVKGKTILIGPNNEGKSNILSALDLAFKTINEVRIMQGPSGRRINLGNRRNQHYQWETDFPIQLREQKVGASTELTLAFELNDSELEEFNSITKSRWQKSLKILIKYEQEKEATFDIVTKGKAKKVINSKKPEIISFIKEHFYFQYIPAIRNAPFINNIIEDLIEAELEVVEDDPNYTAALKQIEATQRPILEKLGVELSTSVKGFLPTVKSFEFKVKEDRARYLRRDFSVMVDDGVKTELQRKGDGIKSLVAISLVKYISEQSKAKKSIILAVEEPEAHLHPKAVHQLKAVLDKVVSNSQIILTTHSPIFVDRMDSGNNILVSDNKARPAKDITKVREILGVQVSDNLASASFIVLVEGEEDQCILQHWIEILSPELVQRIKNGAIMIFPMRGVNNLSYNCAHFREQAFQVYAFLDNDEEARNAYKIAVERGMISVQETHLASIPGMKESEIEDLLDSSLYMGAIQSKYGVDLGNNKFRSNKKKWSDRVQFCFVQQGKPWDDKVKLEVKALVCSCLRQGKALSVVPAREDLVRGLIKSIEDKTKHLN